MKNPNRGSMGKILLVEDNRTFREVVAIGLEDAGYVVIESDTAEGGIAHLARIKVKAVIADIRLAAMDGIEFLEFVKTNYGIPVILMTGIQNLIETQDAFALGAAGMIAKPFEDHELVAVLAHALLPPPTQEPPREIVDSQYCKLSIEDFITGHTIKFDIFIRLNGFRYLKIAHEGADISPERLTAYKSKGITHLYMKREDFRQYIGFNRLISGAVLQNDQFTREKKLNFLKHNEELLLEATYTGEIDSDLIQYSQNTVQMVSSILLDHDETFEMIQMLNSHSDYLYAHCLGVSFYSVLLARAMGWKSMPTLCKLGIAGIFHDIGKKEISRDLVDKPRKNLTSEEIKLLETHPQRGMEILAKLPSVSSDILLIILQHHENCNGTGYPSGLRLNKIHPLARLLSVANEFSNLVIKGPGQAAIRPAEALHQLSTLYTGVLDSKVLKALSKALRIETE